MEPSAADKPSLARRDLGPWAYALVGALVTALVFVVHLKTPRVMSGGVRSTILAAPVGGETWVVGATVHIILDHPGSPPNPRPALVQLSRDGGTTWEELVDLTTVRLTVYPWRVSGPPSDSCVMRVIDLSIGMRHASQRFTIKVGADRGSELGGGIDDTRPDNQSGY